MKIFVAIPTYDGKLQHQTVNCLVLEQAVAVQCGDELNPCFMPYCSHPADGRNNLVKSFLESGCEKLFFLDSDITFEPGALLKVAHAPVDFAAGCTRHKLKEESYPITFLDKDWLIPEANGLLEIEAIGTAFVSLSRTVFEWFMASYPNRDYWHTGKKAYCFFQTPFENGSLYGEDTYFCKEWRACGGKIYLNPELEITHWDFKTPYVGHIGNWLKGRNKERVNVRESAQLPQMEAPRN